jgi:uncharacterized protein YeaO (DUF488 family)
MPDPRLEDRDVRLAAAPAYRHTANTSAERRRFLRRFSGDREIGSTRQNMYRVRVKRVYEPALDTDGVRVLVDRIWPRGVTKERAQVDLWLKDLAPSSDLRKWFGHDPGKWDDFKVRYFAELDGAPTVLAELIHRLETSVVTLVFSARDEQHNQAVALQGYLDRRRSMK